MMGRRSQSSNWPPNYRKSGSNLYLMGRHCSRSTSACPDTVAAYCLKLDSNVCACFCRRPPSNAYNKRCSPFNRLGIPQNRRNCCIALCLLHWEPPTGAPPLPSCHSGYLGRLYNRGYVNLPAALVLSCWLAGLDCVDCFQRLHQMLQTCTENTPTGARSGNAWRIPIA